MHFTDVSGADSVLNFNKRLDGTERVLLTSSSLTSNAKRTIDMTQYEGWQNFTDNNFFCEVLSITRTTTTISSSENLIPSYDSQTGILSIPKCFTYFTSGGTYYFYLKYNVYLLNII